jgi:hypothetical protein
MQHMKKTLFWREVDSEVGPLVISLQNFYEGIHSIRISNDLMGFNPVIQRLQDDKETTNT